MTDAELNEIRSCAGCMPFEVTQLLAEVDRLKAACRTAELTIESVMLDKETKEAGLWQGEMLPRALVVVQDALRGKP